MLSAVKQAKSQYDAAMRQAKADRNLRIVELYQNGKSAPEIAAMREIKMSPTAVAYIVRKAGVVPHGRGFMSATRKAVQAKRNAKRTPRLDKGLRLVPTGEYTPTNNMTAEGWAAATLTRLDALTDAVTAIANELGVPVFAKAG